MSYVWSLLRDKTATQNLFVKKNARLKERQTNVRLQLSDKLSNGELYGMKLFSMTSQFVLVYSRNVVFCELSWRHLEYDFVINLIHSTPMSNLFRTLDININIIIPMTAEATQTCKRMKILDPSDGKMSTPRIGMA